jgi:hypothetical protein
MKKIVAVSAIFLITLLHAAVLRADSLTFQCPNGTFVSRGDRMGEVKVKCDPPTDVNKWKETRGSHNRWEEIQIEQWTYNPGPQGFLYVLTFENGVVKKIENVGIGR